MSHDTLPASLAAPVLPGRLDSHERSLLSYHVGVIKRGMKSFIEVGESLAAIRSGRLYRETHTDFNTYCIDTFGFTRSYAFQLEGGAAIASEVMQHGLPEPKNESVTRQLSRVPAEERVEVYRQAVEESEGKSPAANTVKSVLESRGLVLTQGDDDEPMNVNASLPAPAVSFVRPKDPKPHDPLTEAEHKFLDAIPVRDSLSLECRQRYDADALIWFRVQKELSALGKSAQTAGAGRSRAAGPYESRLIGFLKSPSPNSWVSCVACIVDGESTGLDGGSACGQCRGNGYHVKN